MTTEVVVYKNDQVNYLSCGKIQKIGSNFKKSLSNSIDLTHENDFSKYPFPDPIEPSRSTQHIRSEQSPSQAPHWQQANLTEFNKLRQDESLINNVSDYLQVYETNSKRKSMILHQEIEERYLQPLSQKLVQKTNGAEYKKYTNKKLRAISSFDKQAHTNDTYLQKLPQVPLIKFDSSDLSDPILKYRKNNENEKKLTKIIQKSTGQWKPPPTFAERDTLNLKRFKILAETRFYGGSLDSSVAKGKKIFQQKYSSEINTELNNFAAPSKGDSQVPHRRTLNSQIDHIKFGE